MTYTQLKYCREGELEKIENYELAKADNFEGWDIHHRLELTINNEFAHSPESLKRLGIYFNRPYFELIFLRTSEHMKLHATNRSVETLKKMSESLSKRTGELNSFYGHMHSEETRMKIGNANKGRKWTDEMKLRQHNLRFGEPLTEQNRINKAIAQREIGIKYRNYKADGGTMTYNEFRASIAKRRRT